MALNAKLKTYIDEQEKAGKFTPEYAAKMATSLGEFPDDFQGGWLRQQDYDRGMQKAKEVETKWNTWGADAQKTLDDNASALAAANGRVAELEAKLTAGGINEMTHEDLVKQLGELNTKITSLSGASLVTKEEFDRKIAEATRAAKVEAVGFMGDYHSSMEKIKHDYRTWSGKDLAPNEADGIVDFANAKAKEIGRVIPLNEAYEMKFAAEKRTAWEVQKEAEIQKRLETNFRTPIPGSSGGTSEMGPLQIRMKELEGGNKDWTASGTLQEAKAKAAAALRADGSF